MERGSEPLPDGNKKKMLALHEINTEQSSTQTKLFLREYDPQKFSDFVKKGFMPYFRDIFKELCERSHSENETISKNTFVDVSRDVIIDP